MKAGHGRCILQYLFAALIVLLSATACNGNEGKVPSPAPTPFSQPGVHPGLVHGFVTRTRTRLMLNGSPFRFSGANIHWLALDDNGQYVSQFRVNDALDTAREMGATVVRSHTVGISVGCPNCLSPRAGVFNQAAFERVDYVLMAARARGMRLVIPLTDNWHYAYGGKHTFTDWRGISDEEQFYTNRTVVADFETYISMLLNHVNVYTGVAYKDDPTILAWETGNELVPPTDWTQEIATFLKTHDPHHLVIDGRDGIDPDAARLKNVDIVTHHYYPMELALLREDSAAAQKAGKVFYAGEFNWNDSSGHGTALNAFLAAIETDSMVAGNSYWELWAHDDHYGYISNEPEYTLHYPGDNETMSTHAQVLRAHAYRMSGVPVPPDGRAGTPEMRVVVRGHHNLLVWRGATLAASYSAELSTSGSGGPWTTICARCANDTNTPWLDTTTRTGNVWYRVTAYNLAGTAGDPSPPYQAQSGQELIDDLNDWSNTSAHSADLTFDTTNAEHLRGDTSSVQRTSATEQWISWKRPGLHAFQALSYFWPSEPVDHFALYTSPDGTNWTLAHPQIHELRGDWTGYIYTLDALTNTNYVKIVWHNLKGQPWSPQLAQVVLTYA